mgnify:CR=1 FL=1
MMNAFYFIINLLYSVITFNTLQKATWTSASLLYVIIHILIIQGVVAHQLAAYNACKKTNIVQENA